MCIHKRTRLTRARILGEASASLLASVKCPNTQKVGCPLTAQWAWRYLRLPLSKHIILTAQRGFGATWTNQELSKMYKYYCFYSNARHYKITHGSLMHWLVIFAQMKSFEWVRLFEIKKSLHFIQNLRQFESEEICSKLEITNFGEILYPQKNYSYCFEITFLQAYSQRTNQLPNLDTKKDSVTSKSSYKNFSFVIHFIEFWHKRCFDKYYIWREDSILAEKIEYLNGNTVFWVTHWETFKKVSQCSKTAFNQI